MAERRYSLNDSDRKKLKKLIDGRPLQRRSRRPVPTRRRPHIGSHVTQILLTASVSPAVYSSSVITPEPFTARVWFSNDPETGAMEHDADHTIDALSYYLTTITVSSGKGRVGYVCDGRLLIVDCTEFTL